jgi:hypothetical protein
MELNLSQECKFTNMLTTAGSSQGTTEVIYDGNPLDMSGWSSVMFIASLGATVATAKAQLLPYFGDTSGSLSKSTGTTTYCAGFASCTTEHDNTLLVLDYYSPTKRWIGAGVMKGTAATCVKSLTAIQYNRKGRVPYTNQIAGSSGSGRHLVSSLSIVQNST